MYVHYILMGFYEVKKVILKEKINKSTFSNIKLVIWILIDIY